MSAVVTEQTEKSISTSDFSKDTKCPIIVEKYQILFDRKIQNSNDGKTAGSQQNQGFPFSMSIKRLYFLIIWLLYKNSSNHQRRKLELNRQRYLAGVAAPASLLATRARGCNEFYHLKYL